MQPERWQKVKALLQSALELAPDKRDAFLDETCAEDVELRREVESYLKAHDQADSFIEHPAFEAAAPLFTKMQTDILPAETINSYKITGNLGEGGMGVVYLAIDTRLGRRVALKMLHSRYWTDTERVRRFQQEARAASALNHPNILTIYEIGRTKDGNHFIASEFIEGENLRQKLQTQTFSVSETLEIIIQIAAALCAAHEAGIVHRDIKPENIMLREDGLVKVLDFGLVKLIEKKNAPFDTEAATLLQVQTNPGVVMGTFAYMSPEQVRGKDVDARTDIWSLGVILYEMLTGKPPFAGETTSDIIAEILNKKPAPLADYVSGVPKELERIISKTLRKNREERYQHIKDLLIDLKDIKQDLELKSKLENSKTLTKTDKTTADKLPAETDANKTRQTSGVKYITTQIKSHKFGVASAIIVFIVAAIAGTYYFLNHKPNETAFVFQAGETSRLTLSGRVKTAVVSPDGKFITYAQEENDERQSLWMRHVGSESNVQIAAPASIEYRALNISPDGNSIYYIDAKGTLYRMAVLGGTPKKVAEELLSYGKISFSPDGKQIAFVRRFEKEASALFTASTDGTNERRLASFEQPIRLGPWLAWSPDGKVIACWFINAGYFHNILAVQVADGTFAPILPQGWLIIEGLAWMPDSKSLLMVGITDENALDLSQVWQISYPGGEVRRIINDTNNYYHTNLTSDGRFLVAVRTEQVAHVWVMLSNDASRARQLTAGFEKYDGTDFFGWMPDGKIVYDSSASGKLSVWVTEADGSKPRQLVKDAVASALSPDGRYLVSQNNIGLWRTDLKEGSEMQLTRGVDVWATFSPDGKWIVYTGFHGRVSLLKVPVEGGEPTQILDERATCPAVSPDGKTIAVVGLGENIALVSFDSGKMIKRFDTKPETNPTSDKQNLQWTPDGRGIYFVALNNGVSNIWRQPIDGSPPVQVTKFETGRIFNFAFSPDGKQLALSRGSFNSDVVLIRNAENTK